MFKNSKVIVFMKGRVRVRLVSPLHSNSGRCIKYLPVAHILRRHHDTVQTFHYYTSRPDVSQCLVVQTPTENMSKRAKHINAHVACGSKLRSVVNYLPCIYTLQTRLQSGVRSCFLLGLPAHLVQELNVDTVCY